MSLTKLKRTEEIKRNSFEDRVCDDLSEVILQYLSIEDKFRFHCVSKQFQRTVFQKEYELDLSLFYDKIKNLSIRQKLSKSVALEVLL